MAISPNDLKAILDGYSSNTLVDIAAFFKALPEKQRTKVLLIERIIHKITDPVMANTIVQSLTKTDRALLDAILRRDGNASLRSLRAELVRQDLIDAKSRVEFGEYSRMERPDPRAERSRRLEDHVASLMLRGLVFPHELIDEQFAHQNKRTLYDQTSQVFIPELIRKHLPVPAETPETITRINEVQNVQEGSARVFQRDLYLLWSYIRDSKPGLTMKDELLKNALKEIGSSLLSREEIGKGETEHDHPRVRFLRGVLTALKLVNETRNRTVEAGQVTDFFAMQPDERVRKTYDTWLDTDQFNELLLIGPARPRPTSIPLIPARPQVVRARKFVLEQARKLINSLGKDSWIPLQGLVDRIYEQNYEFFLRRLPMNIYYNVLLNPYDYSGNEMGLTFPGVQGDEAGWQQVEANLIRGVITGPLYWMGLVDLGWTAKEEPAAFRLTALGAWVFGLGPKPEIPVEGGRVIVQPNLHVMALDPIQDAVLATLDRFAERLSAERAVEYRMTRASVYTGQLAGWDVPKIIEALETLTGSSLPGNVTRTLEEWQAQYERITIRSHVALMHGDPAAIEKVVGDSSLRGHIQERPVPEVAVLQNSKSMNRIVELLRAREVWPLVNIKPVVPANAITCTEDGLVRLTTRVPSLYLHGHLAPFADPFEDGYQITHASVQRAARSGLSANEILERLLAAHLGPLPDKLTIRIRAWARHYGDAGLTPLTVLQLRDAETLEELLADPEVGPLIKRFAPKRPNALAQVAPENVEKLRALLVERGVDIHEKIA